GLGLFGWPLVVGGVGSPGLRPGLRCESPIRGSRQAVVGDFDEPLVAEVGLDDGLGAVGVLDAVAVGFSGFEQAASFELAEDELAGLFAGLVQEDLGAFELFRIR